MVNPKNVFWQALISAVLIFGIGLLLGVYLEDSRSRAVEANLLNSEINIQDNQLALQINENFNISCENAIKNNIEFADKIYNEAKTLENYDASSDLTSTLEILHKRYDILRTVLWLQSIKIKKECKSNIMTIVYLYQYKDPPIEIKSEQITFSRALSELKDKYGNKIVLIPIAGDLNITSLETIKKRFAISTLPAVIIDEKTVIQDLSSLGNISLLIQNNNNK